MAASAPAIEQPGASGKSTPPSPAADREPAKPREGERWQLVEDLQCDLTVDLPVPGFKVGDLIELRQGSVIAAHLRVGRDVPLRLNGALVGWIEFEAVGDRLAVRLTELA